MRIIVNEVTGLRELVINAILRTVGTEARFTKPTEAHPDGAEFRGCECEVTYPSGKVAIVDSTIWKTSLTKFPNAFLPGKVISLTTQLEGEGAGYSKVGLPIVKVGDSIKYDLDALEQLEIFDEEKEVIAKNNKWDEVLLDEQKKTNTESNNGSSNGCVKYLVITLGICSIWFLKGCFSWRGFDAIRGLQEIGGNLFLLFVFVIIGIIGYAISKVF